MRILSLALMLHGLHDSHGMGNDFHYLRLFEAIVDYCEENWDGEK